MGLGPFYHALLLRTYGPKVSAQHDARESGLQFRAAGGDGSKTIVTGPCVLDRGHTQTECYGVAPQSSCDSADARPLFDAPRRHKSELRADHAEAPSMQRSGAWSSLGRSPRAPRDGLCDVGQASCQQDRESHD